MSPQEHLPARRFTLNEKGVPHIARGVIGRNVELFEVVLVQFDLGSVKPRGSPAARTPWRYSLSVCVIGCSPPTAWR